MVNTANSAQEHVRIDKSISERNPALLNLISGYYLNSGAAGQGIGRV
jgi:hypothetical protein